MVIGWLFLSALIDFTAIKTFSEAGGAGAVMRQTATASAATPILLASSSAAQTRQAPKPKPPPTTAPSTTWDLEPETFRGVAWGATEEELKSILGSQVSCRPYAAQSARLCGGTFEIGGDPEAMNIFTLKGDSVVDASLYFKSKSYDAVKAALIEKYGRPTLVVPYPVRTRMNVEYQNEMLIWRGRTISLLLERYGEDVNSSIAMFVTPGELKAIEDRKRLKAKADADKF